MLCLSPILKSGLRACSVCPLSLKVDYFALVAELNEACYILPLITQPSWTLKSTEFNCKYKCHETSMRIGVEYTRNYLQQRCHILGIRIFLRSLAFEYFDCRRFRAQGLQPPMADLPDIRFQETQSPVIFTNVGVDYLGPFAVVHQDAEVKTYICLFTCLVTRAIHLEVAEDLSTDKCLTAIRRFIARRGQPHLFLPDNGFDFLGQ